MALQTQFTENMRSAFPGQWYDISDTEAVSRSAELTAIPFGVAVVNGTHDNQVRLPDDGDYFSSVISGAIETVADENVFVGISMYHTPAPDCAAPALVRPIGNGDKGYLKITETVSCATQGRIYVVCETDVKIGDDVFFRHTLADAAANPQPEQLGALSNVDSGETTTIKGAQWMSTSAAGELAIVKLV